LIKNINGGDYQLAKKQPQSQIKKIGSLNFEEINPTYPLQTDVFCANTYSKLTDPESARKM